MSVIAEARKRQQRRRAAVGAAVLAAGMAALVLGIAGGGGGSGSRTSAGRADQLDSGRAFAKYGLPCYALRAAAISVGPKSSRWCKPDSTAGSHFVVYPPNMRVFPPATCKVLRASGIPVGPETSKGCEFRFALLPKRA